MNKFTYRVISDGPHRPEDVYLVTGPTLLTSGQLLFGARGDVADNSASTELEEEVPPLRLVFEDPQPVPVL